MIIIIVDIIEANKGCDCMCLVRHLGVKVERLRQQQAGGGRVGGWSDWRTGLRAGGRAGERTGRRAGGRTTVPAGDTLGSSKPSLANEQVRRTCYN